MSAALVVTPTEVQEGDSVVVTGSGFLPSTTITMTIPEQGLETQITSDASGAFSTQDLADLAVGTLTSDGTVPTAADTVTVGSVTYTFRASVSTTANEVLLGSGGSAAADSLSNLKAAINKDTSQPTKYGSLTVVNPTVGAGALTATTLVLYAKTGGTAGNSLATTEASSHLSFAASTLLGGTASTNLYLFLLQPSTEAPFTVNATDGTSTATARVMVFTK